jgi:hypothetical protein
VQFRKLSMVRRCNLHAVLVAAASVALSSVATLLIGACGSRDGKTALSSAPIPVDVVIASPFYRS